MSMDDKATPGVVRAVGYLENWGVDYLEPSWSAPDSQTIIRNLYVTLCGQPIEIEGNLNALYHQRVEVLIVPLGDELTYREQGLERQVASLTRKLSEANDTLARLRKKLKRRGDDAQALLG